MILARLHLVTHARGIGIYGTQRLNGVRAAVKCDTVKSISRGGENGPSEPLRPINPRGYFVELLAILAPQHARVKVEGVAVNDRMMGSRFAVMGWPDVQSRNAESREISKIEDLKPCWMPEAGLERGPQMTV